MTDNEPTEYSVYREMIAELDARINPLQQELSRLLAAETRIVAIRTKLSILEKERAEYDALLPKQAAEPTVTTGSLAVLSTGPTTNTPKFDR